MSKTDIFVIGVGGQGSLMATKIMGDAALRAGLDVMSSEVHGMAQRGGVVQSTVRLGDVKGPLIADGDAEVLLAFEPAEAVRAIAKVDPEKTTVIVNTSPIYPFTVSLGMAEYPDLDAIFKELEGASKKLVKVDIMQIAKDNGLPAIAANVILLGVLSGSGTLPISKEIMLETVLDNVPKKFTEENRKAFELGYEYGQGQ